MMSRKGKVLFLLVFSVLMWSGNQEKMLHFNRSGVVVDSKLFSLNIVNMERGASWPKVNFASWRIFNSAWSKIEPKQGVWDFKLLDSNINDAIKNKVEPLLVLAMCPPWASKNPTKKGCCIPVGSSGPPISIALWKKYVRTVALRYKGKVKVYELWNEPNQPKHYFGDLDTLLELSRVAYKELKLIDPTITVVSPSMAPGTTGISYLDKYLKKGGGAYADVIGYHFYTGEDIPEKMVNGISVVQRVMKKHGVEKKPLWNTEAGWKILNTQKWKYGYGVKYPLSQEYASAYLARAYILNWASGVDRFYWYAWGHTTFGLSDVDGRTPKEAAKTFDIVRGWLVNNTVNYCKMETRSIWVCELNSAKKSVKRILWNTNGAHKYKLPASWKISKVTNLKGTQKNTGIIDSVNIGISPIMVE